jgi:hydroxymethylbilane synthase
MNFPLRLGTRGSPLALAQARLVAEAVRAAHGFGEDAVAIVPIRTTGDAIQDRPLAEIGGKALWTKELDRALIDGAIDFAVHSMKDVETLRPAEIAIAAMLPRADVRERLIGAASIEALPQGARVGTSSPRRAAQLRAMRLDLRIVPFRGNVATRIARLGKGEAEATVLAAAGLDRLGEHDVGTPVSTAQMLPAPQQGAIGIETLADHAEMRALLAAIDHAPTRLCVETERALLLALGADCHSPVAALATLDGELLTLDGEILNEDGSEAHRRRISAPSETAADEAAILARALLDSASPGLRALFRE